MSSATALVLAAAQKLGPRDGEGLGLVVRLDFRNRVKEAKTISVSKVSGPCFSPTCSCYKMDKHRSYNLLSILTNYPRYPGHFKGEVIMINYTYSRAVQLQRHARLLLLRV